MFISASTEIKFHSWPQIEGEPDPIYTSNGHSKVTHVSWCNDNNYLALLSEKNKPEILSTRNRRTIKLIHTVQSINDATAVAFQKTTKKSLGLGTGSGQVALYDTKHRAITKLYASLGSVVKHIDFNVIDSCMGVACKNGTLTAYCMLEDESGETFKLPNASEATVMRFHPENCSCLAAATVDGDVVLYDVAASRKIFFAQSHTSAVTGLAMALSGGTLVSVGEDHKMCIYDLNINECLFRNNLQQPLTAVDMCYDSYLLAVGMEDGFLSLYDMRKLIEPIYSIRAHNSRISKVLFENEHVDNNEILDDCASKISSTSHSSVPTSPDVKGPEKEEKSTIESYRQFKEEVIEALHNQVNDLSCKMKEHFALFKSFMDNEFATMDNVIEEKCDVLKMAGNVEEFEES